MNPNALPKTDAQSRSQTIHAKEIHTSINDLVMSDIDEKDEKNEDDKINLDLDEAIKNLPPVSTWKYRPVFIQPVGDTKCHGLEKNESAPIGVPFDFESKLFKGKILLRLRNLEQQTEDPNSHKAYFDASKFNLQRQMVIQGRFKERMKMSQMYVGDLYDKKLKIAPPKHIGQMMSALFNRLTPGIIMDLVSDKPKVLALIGSGSHTMSIDKPGEEPDITKTEIPENTLFGSDEKASNKRKQILGRPKQASQHEFDPDLVYTFHMNDENIDLAEFQLHLPFLKIDFTKVLGDGQPMSLRALNYIDGDNSQTESFFFLRCFHERSLVQAEKKKKKKKDGSRSLFGHFK